MDCYWRKPEDCSVCELREVIDHETQSVSVLGRCVCAPALRCTKCTIWTHYRLNGECAECPKNHWVLIVGIIFAASSLGTACYYMKKRNVNIAYLSVGVDYFQVLAMFAASKTRWPPLIRKIMLWFSMFNLNLDIAAPECAFPDITFTTKWSMIQSVPLISIVLMLVGHAIRLVVRKVQHRRTSWRGGLALISGNTMLLLYCIFLPMTKSILDVFNCSPTIPPDGYMYMEAVFERCWEPGGVHMTLYPVAIVFGCLYTIGIPTFFAWILFKNPVAVQEDLDLFSQIGRGQLEYMAVAQLNDIKRTFDLVKSGHRRKHVDPMERQEYLWLWKRWISVD